MTDQPELPARWARLSVLAGASNRTLVQLTQRIDDAATPSRQGPQRGSDGRIIRDHAWRLHRRRRATIEHVLARSKDWQVCASAADVDRP